MKNATLEILPIPFIIIIMFYIRKFDIAVLGLRELFDWVVDVRYDWAKLSETSVLSSKGRVKKKVENSTLRLS